MYGDEPPLWYRAIRAAKYLQVPVWELQRQPAAYFHQAEAAMAAEVEAENVRNKRANRGHGLAGGRR
jgi:hypothetical protein